jgi:hypothetical protein
MLSYLSAQLGVQFALLSAFWKSGVLVVLQPHRYLLYTLLISDYTLSVSK